ncbi:hypothetical protein EV1_000449 [Malus domestica]
MALSPYGWGVSSKLGSLSIGHHSKYLDARTAYSNALFGPSPEVIVSQASLSRNRPRSELSKEASVRIGSEEAGWGFLDRAGEGLDKDGDWDDDFLVWGDGVLENGVGLDC